MFSLLFPNIKKMVKNSNLTVPKHLSVGIKTETLLPVLKDIEKMLKISTMIVNLAMLWFKEKSLKDHLLNQNIKLKMELCWLLMKTNLLKKNKIMV
jgi:hypothetical protein